MKILITGGSGFIGSHIAQHFQSSAEEIRVLDNFRTGYRKNLDGLPVTLIEGSITDRAIVEKAVQGIDYIFHMAALVSVPESMSKPAECVDINVQGLLHVLEAASAAGVKKIVLASSAAVYGDNPTVPKLETMIPEPKSPYAITKLDGEYYLELYRREGKIQSTSIRFFNVFGPRQDPKGAYAAAVPIFIEKALKTRTSPSSAMAVPHGISSTSRTSSAHWPLPRKMTFMAPSMPDTVARSPSTTWRKKSSRKRAAAHASSTSPNAPATCATRGRALTNCGPPVGNRCFR
jgi:nucleoside-diphosphate-sugar epimerase